MIKYFKYGLLFFRKHYVTYLLMIFQLAFLLIAENVLISNLNSRDVLYTPYENIISKDGYYYYQNDAGGIWDENGDTIKTADDVLSETLSKLRGDYSLYTYYYTSMLGGEESALRINIVEDEIYYGLMLPLKNGAHSTEKNTCMITANDIGITVGDTLDFENVSLAVTGVLTDTTYIPDYRSISREMSVQDLYEVYSSDSKSYADVDMGDSTITLESAEVIAPKSAFEELINGGSNGIFRSSMMIIAFDEPQSQEDRAYNESILASTESRDPGWFVKLEQIQEKGLIYRNEDFNKMLPIVVCIIVVIFIGIICSSAIISARQLRKYAILYIVGAKSSDCIIISCVTAFISSVISLAIALLVLILGIANSFANELGFVWGANNVVAVAATVVFTIISFGVIPSGILRKKRFTIKHID